jgi:Flp pilus assembly protein TadD
MTAKKSRYIVFLIPLVTLGIGCSSSDLRNGSVSIELGDYPLAIHFFSRVLEKNPANFEARLGMGKALLQKAIDNDDSASWQSALMHLEAARTVRHDADLDPLLSQAWAQRADGLLRHADTLRAIEALTKAIAFDPKNPGPLNRAGIIYYRLGNTEKARQLFESATRADTADISAVFNLGMIYWERGDPKAAHDLWMKAIKKSPEDEVILYWFAAANKRLTETPSRGKLQ